MNAKTALTTLAAALVLAVLAVPAAAAPSYAPKYAKFIASIKGKQVTTWEEPRWPGHSNCQGRAFTEGGGTETVTFRSRRPFRILATKAGAVHVKYGTWGRFDYSRDIGIPAPGSVTRAGRIVHSIEPGYCFGGGPTESDTGPYDCRTIKRPGWRALLSWRGNRMEVTVLDGDRVAPTGPEEHYRNCPLVAGEGADEGEITTISQRYPVRDLFDRSQGLVEVLGRRRFTYEDVFRHATTTVSWKLRLRRVR